MSNRHGVCVGVKIRHREICRNPAFLDAGKIPDPDPEDLAEAAIKSVSKAKAGNDGITYLSEAISDGVDTLLTDRYAAAILAKGDSPLLKEALKSREARRLGDSDRS